MAKSWIIDYEHYFPDGKVLTIGMTFRCTGEKGKVYRYIKTVTNGSGDVWIECFGGSHQRECSRSILPDRINTASFRQPKRKAE